MGGQKRIPLLTVSLLWWHRLNGQINHHANKTINFGAITDLELWENTSIAAGAGVEAKWGSEKGAGAERGEEVQTGRALWGEARGGAIVGAEAGRGRGEVGAE